MAPPVTDHNQIVQFLVSCIRFTNNGKIDFAEVAKECEIVSKGAAAKRYERLLKANGIGASGGTSSTATATATAATAPSTPVSGTENETETPMKGKKRKAVATPSKPRAKPRTKKFKVTKEDAVMRAESLVEKKGGVKEEEEEDEFRDLVNYSDSD